MRSLLYFLIFIFSFNIPVLADDISRDNPDNPKAVTSQFRNKISLNKVSISIPTVIEINFNDLPEQMAIYNVKKNRFEPFREINRVQNISFKILNGKILNGKILNGKILNGNNLNVQNLENNTLEGNTLENNTTNEELNSKPQNSEQEDQLFNLSDNNFSTHSRFDVEENQVSESTLLFVSSSPITTDQLHIYFAPNSARPNKISILQLELENDATQNISQNNSQNNSKHIREKVIVNTTNFTSPTSFTEITGNRFIVKLIHSQPLTLSEAYFNTSSKNYSNAVRFLAQPNDEYEIYTDPENYVHISTEEMPNLDGADQITKYQGSLTKTTNSAFLKSDIDKDGIPDSDDNCVNISNREQTDINNNQRGDACDDFDLDGILNHEDNCINEPNSIQIDSDLDGIGDKCDSEESRLTENNKWIPWAAIAGAVLIFLILALSVLKDLRKNKG